VLDHLQPAPTLLELAAEEATLLDDWDTPSDVR
jgi:hypothetical protein